MQLIELARAASAVAVAAMSTESTPNSLPKIVGISLSRATLRRAHTLTRLGWPAGSLGNVTSSGHTDGAVPIIALACAAEIAAETAGPVVVRLSKSLKASAIAPDNAPESAAVCACDLADMNIPTSIASVVAVRNAMNPIATNAIVIPRSLRRRCRNLLRMEHL